MDAKTIIEIIEFILKLIKDGLPKEAAFSKAASRFGCSVSDVKKAFSKR